MIPAAPVVLLVCLVHQALAHLESNLVDCRVDTQVSYLNKKSAWRFAHTLKQHPGNYVCALFGRLLSTNTAWWTRWGIRFDARFRLKLGLSLINRDKVALYQKLLYQTYAQDVKRL